MRNDRGYHQVPQHHPDLLNPDLQPGSTGGTQPGGPPTGGPPPGGPPPGGTPTGGNPPGGTPTGKEVKQTFVCVCAATRTHTQVAVCFEAKFRQQKNLPDR